MPLLVEKTVQALVDRTVSSWTCMVGQCCYHSMVLKCCRQFSCAFYTTAKSSVMSSWHRKKNTYVVYCYTYDKTMIYGSGSPKMYIYKVQSL